MTNVKRNFFTIFILLITALFSHASAIEKSRKKILVLMSTGGAGHINACNVLKAALPEYDYVVTDGIDITLSSSDPIKIVTLKKYHGEDFYNGLISNGWNKVTNWICRHPGPYLFHCSRKKFENRIVRLLQKEKPDLFISTIPLINYSACNAAARCNVPFFLMALDADLTLWLNDVELCRKPFPVTLSYPSDFMYKQLSQKHVPPEKIYIVGPPLKAAFYTPKDHKAIKKEWNIPEGKQVIMVLMGGAGSGQLYSVAKNVFNLPIKAHLLLCIGRNEAQRKQLEKLKKTKDISYTIIPFTDKIPDLEAVSDLLITKPGPNSCNEAMFCQLPILIDNTQTTLFWERATMHYVQENGFGTTFKSYKQLGKLIPSWLARKKAGLISKPPFKCFKDEIRFVIEKMLAEHSVIKAPNHDVIQPTKTCEHNPQIGATVT
jgi:processive 1,2-diacylglycerol beta-glucosyltransferase